MIIVNCPNCHSKFRFSEEGLSQTAIKMRCSICQHVFSYTIEQEVSLEKEFDMLLSSASGDETTSQTQSPPLQEEVFTETSMEIAETPVEEAPSEEQEKVESQAAPESVIREIDSILGTGTQAQEEEEELLPEETKKRSVLKTAVLAICLLAAALSSLWLFRDKIPFIGKSETDTARAPLQKGPFFTIDEQSLSWEILTHEQEGSVLVIKGNLKKITDRPVESVMVEARVYDRGGKVIETRLAYAGIIPDTTEFIKQPSRDIDALLTADPASPGSTLPASNIPFAVAFFGKSAKEGSTFKVEVKDIRWK